MADKPAEQEQPQTESEPEVEHVSGDLESKIREVVANLLGSGKAKVSDDAGVEEDTAAATKRAVAAVKARNTKEQNSLVEQLTSSIEELKEQVKAKVESAPTRIRPIEKFLGWRHDDE
jgi:hypothetical protein